MAIKNKDVKQSFLLTTARYSLTVYQKRLIYKIVEIAQASINGVTQSDGRFSVETSDNVRTCDISIDIKELAELTGSHKAYEELRKACVSLSNMHISVEDGKSWKDINLLAFPEYDDTTAQIKFSVSKDFWKTLCDFSKGFSTYELRTAMKLKSAYAMRMYELVSNQPKGISLTYSIEELKEKFGVSEKYSLTSSFINKVILSAQAELNEKAPWTFTFQPLKTGRRITAIKFYPEEQQQYRDEELEESKLIKQIAPSLMLPDQIRLYFTQTIGMTQIQLRSNQETILQAMKVIPNFDEFIRDLWGRARTGDKGIGWVINAMKAEISKQVEKN